MSVNNPNEIETTQAAATTLPLKKRLMNYAVKYLLPLVLTVLLVWYMFAHIDINEMIDILRHGVDYRWILLAMGISVLSHVVRALRWRIQLRALGINPPLMALCCSIFGTYALNLVFPRLGEVWRCTYIANREKAPFTTVLGSMVADRLSDTVMVLLITVFTFFVAQKGVTAFITQYKIGQDAVSLAANPLFWGIVVACVALFWAIFHFGKENKVIAKVRSMIMELWGGFIGIIRIKGKWLFIALTFALWGCYFLQLYVAFFAFSYTTELCTQPGLALGLIPCLVAFVLSSIGMAIPSNGGLGPWNIAVMFGLAIYGISETEGTSFSLLVWSAQTVMLIILGIFTMIYITSNKPKKIADAK
jgi:hypothetical protein